MPLTTPTTPSISGVTPTLALVTKGADGNGAGTYYAFQVSYTVGLSPQIMYLKSDGSFNTLPVWINTTSLTATALIPNTLFSISLAAATDALGDNSTGFGPPATFTTAAAQPLFQPFSGIYSTTVTANWLPNFNSDETQYYVQLSTDPAFIFNVINSGWVTDNSYIFTNLDPNTIYYGQVQARNGVLATTPFTTLGSVTTPAGPAVVQGIRATNLLANRGFIIQWAANVEPNIAVYRVYRSSSPTDNSSFYMIGTTPANVTSFVDNVPYTFGISWYYKVTALDNGNNESPLNLTNPVQDMSFSQFVEQPFPTTVEINDIINNEIPSGQQNGVNTTITTVTDATHLVVGSTAGWITGAAIDITASIPFTITTVTDATHLIVNSTTGMASSDVLIQGNTLFTTAYPFKASTLDVYLNGVKLMLGIDFTLNIPQQFTLVEAPLPTDYLRIGYIKF
jgi:fibronectin type 3 domain-containing protein